MGTDIKLDQVDGNWVTVEAGVIQTSATDLILDSPRRGPGGGTHRRALVHNERDGLTINFNGDYPGGVTIHGLDLGGSSLTRLRLEPSRQNDSSPALPKTAEIGELHAIRTVIRHNHQVISDVCSLWMCTGRLDITNIATWQQVPLSEESVAGTRE